MASHTHLDDVSPSISSSDASLYMFVLGLYFSSLNACPLQDDDFGGDFASTHSTRRSGGQLIYFFLNVGFFFVLNFLLKFVFIC